MTHWQKLLAQSITTQAQLEKHFGRNFPGIAPVLQRYPMRINPYYLGLIQHPGDAIWRQAVPDKAELTDNVCLEDPLDEENLSPAPNLVHKYPDRALFLVSSQCAMYCRFCTRKRKVGTARMEISRQTMSAGLRYLRETPAIRDVLVSGGDPLLLPDETLAEILAALRSIRHIDIIRIGSRVPCTLPMRVTSKLAAILKRYHPLFISTHFNHPREITPAAAKACARLADAGIPLGNQTVLLKGVNDDPEVMSTLMRSLLKIRVKPYYLFQTDLTRGTNHFRTSIATGLQIMRELINHASDAALPTYAVDAPGGGGKIPLLPEHVQSAGKKVVAINYKGQVCTYLNP